MTNGVKFILIITVYRLPEGAAQGVYAQRAQMNCKEKKVKLLTTYRAELLKDLS